MPFLGGEMVFEFMADAFFFMLGVLCWTTTGRSPHGERGLKSLQ